MVPGPTCEEKTKLTELVKATKEIYANAAREAGEHSTGGFELAYHEALKARSAHSQANAALEAHTKEHGC